MADQDRESTPNSEYPQDFNRMMVEEHSTGTARSSGTGTNRDLGTVGGGTIPNAGPSVNTSTGSANTDDSTAGAGGSTGTTAAGAGAATDRGTMTNRDQTTNSGNTMDRNAESNLGGRNPSHPQTAMGDRDADIQRGHSSSTSPVQPMTSRDPGNRSKDQDSEKGS